MKSLTTLAIIFSIWFLFALCRTGERRSGNGPTEKPMRKISASVRLSVSGVVVTNTDAVDFPSVSLRLNMKQTGGDDGRSDIGTIQVGKTVTVPYGEFTIGTKRFNPNTTKIMTVVVKTPIESDRPSYKVFLCPSSVCQPSE